MSDITISPWLVLYALFIIFGIPALIGLVIGGVLGSLIFKQKIGTMIGGLVGLALALLIVFSLPTISGYVNYFKGQRIIAQFCTNPNGESTSKMNNYTYVSSCKNGKLNGPSKTYNAEGHLVGYSNYVEGEWRGFSILMDNNGVTQVDVLFQSNVNKLFNKQADDYQRIYEKGKPMSLLDFISGYEKENCENWRKGEKFFLAISNCSADNLYDGAVKYFRQYQKSDGSYSKDTFLGAEATFVNGKVEGLFIIYSIDRHQKVEIPFKDNVIDGDAKYYVDQQVLDTLHFSNGIPDSKL